MRERYRAATVVLRAGRNGERAVRVFRQPFSSYHRGVDGLLSLENSVKELLGKRCSALSGGELRRVYLWSAISRKSSVLVLDEPTTGLDAVSRAELAAYVKRNKQSQLIIIVSHDARWSAR